jgi:short-subunit dehydrogenase
MNPVLIMRSLKNGGVKMNEVALITGASSGMGKETARLLAKKGFIVYGAARSIDKMRDLKNDGVNVISMDVTSEDSIDKGINAILGKESGIDILVNCAGTGFPGPVENIVMADAKYQMELNLFGPARLIRLVLPGMRERRHGKIINISSVAGKLAVPMTGWYSASKHALEGLSDSLRLETRSFGIKVVLIEPGEIKTEIGEIIKGNMKKVAVNEAYKKMSERFLDLLEEDMSKAPGPSLISSLVLKIVESKNHRPRYHAVHMAGLALFLKRWLPDTLLDRIITDQFGSAVSGTSRHSRQLGDRDG